MYVSKVYVAAVDSYGDVRTLVRGLPYQCPEDWEDVLDSLDEDSNLYLVKEPDNPKDKLAIAAYLDERRVGYVAASDNGKIWLYLTDEKMPCKFIERYDASFKISFDNPRNQFEAMSFEDIYKDNNGLTEKPYPAFEIPFLTNPKDKNYDWFDDKTYIMDFERFIPDFRRKLATRMIILIGRKNSNGEYCYYLPYINESISDVIESTIIDLIDKYGFVIALPDVPMMTHRNAIFMDLHVTCLKKTDFKDFDLEHQSELVFSLTRDYVNIATKDDEDEFDDEGNGEFSELVDSILEGHDISTHKNQPTKHNYKDDYILKEGESINYNIDRSFYNEIDKITTELFTFVRQKLFPSNELFLYLRKNTPYAMQFHDFGEFETLIKVFVIKDLGRIYKILNHSINYDTSEGKVIFLYMAKEAGEKSDEDYETFEKLCNTRAHIEAAVKMRGLIENLMKSYYEYDIVLWTDDDFMIHSFLKEIDEKLAHRYKAILNRFASAVDKIGCVEEQVPNIPENVVVKQDSYDEIEEGEFYNITDSPEGGKHVSMGVIIPEEGDEDFDFCTYECRISDKTQIDLIKKYMKRYEDGKESRPFLMIGRPCLGVDNVDFFYSLDGEIIFKFIFDEKIKSWIRDAGFVLGKVKLYKPNSNWPNELDITLSVSKRKYGENLFKKASEEAMDYIEEVVESTADYKVEGKIIDAVNDYLTGKATTPYQVAVVPWNGLAVYTTLDGEQIGMALDSEIQDLAEKNKGIVGYITDFEYDADEINVEFTIRVSKSIPRIDIEQDYRASDNAEIEDESSSINDLFHILGITLGETTWKQAEDMGNKVEIWKEGPARNTSVEGVTFWDFKGKGIFTSLYWTRSYDNTDFPPLWKSKGFSWDNSYDDWIEVFRKLRFDITITKQPNQSEYSGRIILNATFKALSSDGTLLFDLDFDYGKDGYLTTSPKTLYSITVKYVE